MSSPPNMNIFKISMWDKYENIFKMTILGNYEYLLNCYLRPNDNFVKCWIFSGNEYIFLTSFPFICLVSLTHSQKKFYKKCFISFLQKKWETFLSQLKVFFLHFYLSTVLVFSRVSGKRTCSGSGSVLDPYSLTFWIRILKTDSDPGI